MANDPQQPTIYYHGTAVACRENETLLDAFLRTGVDIDFSCKSGVCHRCMVRCLEGEIPAHAQRKLPEHQKSRGCLLACQCHPTGAMQLAPKSTEDMLTTCVLEELRVVSEVCLRLLFEPLRELNYRQHQIAKICDTNMLGEQTGVLVSTPDQDEKIIIELQLTDASWPAWLQDQNTTGQEFYLRGPFPSPSTEEVPVPAAEPELWEQLGGDTCVRSVMESFYQSVYADPDLSPFFERVTMDRVIGKQFSFLKQVISGEPVYLGEMPRNAHHWMVISDSLFDHRQHLMLNALKLLNIADELIAKWTKIEEQFRSDIVKYQSWPKRVGNILIDTEQYETTMIDEATICDYCSAEIPKYTTVRYHRRIGKVGCSTCSPNMQDNT